MTSAFATVHHRTGQGTQPRSSGWARRPVIVSALASLPAVLAACGGPAASGQTNGGRGSPRAPDGGAPDFKIAAYQGDALLGGRESTLARVLAQGKPVVLNFWAGLCPPCRAEMPAFQKLADEFEGKIVFLGVDVGVFTGLGSRDDARRLLQALSIRYPAAYAVDAAPLRLYGIRSMPTTLFLTPRGQVVERVDGMLVERQMRGKLESLLALAS